MKRLDNGMLIELSEKTGRGPKREEREKEESSLSHPAAHLFIRLRSNELSPCDTHVTRRFFKTGREQEWSWIKRYVSKSPGRLYAHTRIALHPCPS